MGYDDWLAAGYNSGAVHGYGPGQSEALRSLQEKKDSLYTLKEFSLPISPAIELGQDLSVCKLPEKSPVLKFLEKS